MKKKIFLVFILFLTWLNYLLSYDCLLYTSRWENLRADGVTDLGDACEELCQKLSRNSFLRAPSLSYAPVIFLMTDGYPTDNYKKGFEMLKKNRWFQYGLKIALAIGSNVDLDVLREFTDDEELVDVYKRQIIFRWCFTIMLRIISIF